MTDRTIVYTAEEPIESDILNTSKFPMIGIAKLAEALLGQSTQLLGLLCTPNLGGGMVVTVGAGQIYSYVPIDSTAYGAVPPDTTHFILKQGLLQDSENFNVPAPTNPGMSVNYLIEVILQEIDTSSATRDFLAVDSNNVPTGVVYQTAVNGVRQCNCVLTLKTGVQAPTGTQVTPAPDVGYVGAWVVTVNYGDTNILQSAISLYPGAPFISNTVSDFVTKVYADATYATYTYVNSLLLDNTSGDRKFSSNINQSANWLLMNDGLTVGSALSGSTYSSNNYQALFIHLYVTYTDVQCPVSGGRSGVGSTAALNDFNANKKITLPVTAGRVTGNVGSGSGVTTRAVGDSVGSEIHVQTFNELANHPHRGVYGNAARTSYLGNAGDAWSGGGAGLFQDGSLAHAFPTTADGGSAAMSLMQPTDFLYQFIHI